MVTFLIVFGKLFLTVVYLIGIRKESIKKIKENSLTPNQFVATIVFAIILATTIWLPF